MSTDYCMFIILLLRASFFSLSAIRRIFFPSWPLLRHSRRKKLRLRVVAAYR